MNVTAHQEKEKNEETKKGKRRAGEKKKEKTDNRFRTSFLLPFCGRSGSSKAKKLREVRGVTGTLEKANSHFDPTQKWSGTAPPR